MPPKMFHQPSGHHPICKRTTW